MPTGVTDEIQTKASNGQVSVDEQQGIVECFVAAIGNKDSVGDIIQPGAFAGSLQRRKPRVVWGHNWNDPIGKVLEIYEVGPNDNRLPAKMKEGGVGGLYARVQFNLGSEKGREAFASVSFFGEEQEWSIGYKTINATQDPVRQANLLREVELYECSPVLHGANQLTGTISVKGAGQAAVLEHEETHVAIQDGLDFRFDDFDEKDGMLAMMPVETPRDNSSDQMDRKLELELQSRSPQPIRLISAENGIAVFQVVRSDNGTAVFRVHYHYNSECGFMLGRPERVMPQVVYAPVNQPPTMRVKPQVNPSSRYSHENDMMPRVMRIVQKLNDDQKSLERDDLLIEVPVEHAFVTKSLIDPILDYHGAVAEVMDEGIYIHSGATPEFITAVETATKGLGRRIGPSRGGGGGLGKVRRAGRAVAVFDPKAWDGDGDGLVQEGTPFERPSIPGINTNLPGMPKTRFKPSDSPDDHRKRGDGLASGRPSMIGEDLPEGARPAHWGPKEPNRFGDIPPMPPGPDPDQPEFDPDDFPMPNLDDVPRIVPRMGEGEGIFDEDGRPIPFMGRGERAVSNLYREGLQSRYYLADRDIVGPYLEDTELDDRIFDASFGVSGEGQKLSQVLKDFDINEDEFHVRFGRAITRIKEGGRDDATSARYLREEATWHDAIPSYESGMGGIVGSPELINPLYRDSEGNLITDPADLPEGLDPEPIMPRLHQRDLSWFKAALLMRERGYDDETIDALLGPLYLNPDTERLPEGTPTRLLRQTGTTQTVPPMPTFTADPIPWADIEREYEVGTDGDLQTVILLNAWARQAELTPEEADIDDDAVHVRALLDDATVLKEGETPQSQRRNRRDPDTTVWGTWREDTPDDEEIESVRDVLSPGNEPTVREDPPLPADDGSFAAELEKKVGLRSSRRATHDERRRELAMNSPDENLAMLQDALERESDWDDAHPDFDIDSPPDAGPKGYSDELEAWGDQWEERLSIAHEIDEILEFYHDEESDTNDLYAEQREVAKTLNKDRDSLKRWIGHSEGDIEPYLLENDKEGYLQKLRDEGWDVDDVDEMERIFGSARDTMDDIFEGNKEWERLEGEIGEHQKHGFRKEDADQIASTHRETRRGGLASRKTESRRERRAKRREQHSPGPKERPIVPAGRGLGHDREVYPRAGDDAIPSDAVLRVSYDAGNQELQVWFRQASQTTGEGSLAHAYVYGGVTPDMVDGIENISPDDKETIGGAINRIKKEATYTKKPNGSYDGKPLMTADRVDADIVRLRSEKVLNDTDEATYKTVQKILKGDMKGASFEDRFDTVKKIDDLALRMMSNGEPAAANRLHEARHLLTTGDPDRINPHPSGIMQATLSEKEVADVRRAMQVLATTRAHDESDRKGLLLLDKKLEEAKGGTFRVSTDEYKQIMDAFSGLRHSDPEGVHVQARDILEFAALSENGKWTSPRVTRKAGAGPGLSSRRVNNGAPSDISPRLQGDLMHWGRQQGGFHNVQEIVRRYDRNEGNLSPKDWIRLYNYYGNHSPAGKGMRPYGEARRAGLRSGVVGAGEAPHNDKRFLGKRWTEIKPKDWDLYSPEEKQRELETNLHPAKSGLSVGDHERLDLEVKAEIDKIRMSTDPEYRKEILAEKRQFRLEQARAARARGEEPKPYLKPKPQSAEKKPVAASPEEAQKSRSRELAQMHTRVGKNRDRVNDAMAAGEADAKHLEFWDSLQTRLNDDDDDFGLATLEDLHDRLEEYVSSSREGDLTPDESKSVGAASTFLTRISDRLTAYEDDQFIDRTGSSDIGPRVPGGSGEAEDAVETMGGLAVDGLGSRRAEGRRASRIASISDELNKTRASLRGMERGDIEGTSSEYQDLQLRQQSQILRLGRATGLHKGGKKNRDVMAKWRNQKLEDGVEYKRRIDAGEITPLPKPLSDEAIRKLTPGQRVARREQREEAIRDLFAFQAERDGKVSTGISPDFYERIGRPTTEERLETRMASRMTPEQRLTARQRAMDNRRTAEARPEREGATEEGLSSRMRNERQGLRTQRGRNWDEEGEEDLPTPTRSDQIAADAAEAIVGERRPPTESDVPIGIGEDQRLPDKPDINAMPVGELKRFISDGQQQIIETHQINDVSDPNYPHPALTDRDWFDQTEMVPTSFIDEAAGGANVGDPGGQEDFDRIAQRGIETPIVLRFNPDTGEHRLEQGEHATLDANGWDSAERYHMAKQMGLRAVPMRIVRDGDEQDLNRDGVRTPKTMSPSHAESGVPTLTPTRELQNLKIFVAARQGSAGQARREDIRRGVRSRKGRRSKADLRDAFTASYEKTDAVLRGLGLAKQTEQDKAQSDIDDFVLEAIEGIAENTKKALQGYLAKRMKKRLSESREKRSRGAGLRSENRGVAYEPIKNALEGVTEGLRDALDPDRRKKKPQSLPRRERPTIPMKKPDGLESSKRDQVKSRSKVSGKSSHFKIVYDSLDKEIAAADKNNDPETAESLKKLKKSFEYFNGRSIQYGPDHPKQTDSGTVQIDDDSIDGVIEALAIVLSRQQGINRGSGSVTDRENALARYLGSIERSGGVTPADAAMTPIRIAALEQFLEMLSQVGMELMNR